MLVGRDDECAQLQKVLTDAVTGSPQIVALRGDPGIGKTRLLEFAAADERFRAIRVQGHEAEREIPYAALSMLVGPLVGEVGDLPPVLAAALEGALNLGPAVHGDRMGIAAATVAVLAAVAERQPLLLAVDDVQLIDPPTLDTLIFALRRMDGERLAVIVTARSEHDVSPFVQRWLDSIRHQIPLGGLDLAAARRLTAHRGALSTAVWEASGGNPLALLEMTAPDNTVFLDEPLQLSARLLRAYGHRLVGLPDRARDALLLLAVGGRATDAFDDALAHRGLRRADLDPAEDGGLVVVEEGVVRFTHPLVCSAVYYSASPAMKRSAHQTMVAVYDGRRAPGVAERQAFHLAAATAGPEEGVAARIAEAAAAAAARHSLSTAAALFEKAARLSPPGPARGRRLIEAALAGQAAGTLEAAGRLLVMAVDETEEEDLRTVAMHLQCRVQMWSGHPAQARDQLLDLAERTEERYPAWSATMRSHAAIVSIALGEQRLASGMARRAAEIATGLPDPSAAVPVLIAQACTEAINGEVEVARDLLRRCAPHLPDCDPLSIDQLLVMAALAYASLGETATARHWLETAVRKARSVQAAGLLPFQLSWLTLMCWLEGDWVAALAHGAAAVQVAEETGWATELPNCLVALATVEATLGHTDECLRHLALATSLGAAQSEARVFAAHEARVTGLLELGAGRPTEAVAALTPAAGFALAGKLGDPVLFNWAGNLTEALFRAGRREQALHYNGWVLREAEQTGRPAARAVAARCRGLLAPSLDEARASFEEALRWHEDAAEPFEQARTQLCYGEVLRRHRQRAEAKEQLDRAVVTFSRLGATPWVRLAETELSTVGGPARARGASATQRLTTQELQVALVVAEGLTNADAAARLFRTPKTIEFHLSNIYRKLRIRSRAELILMMRDGMPDPLPDADVATTTTTTTSRA